MSENYLLLQRREKYFLLTSPFIEPGIGLKKVKPGEEVAIGTATDSR